MAYLEMNDSDSIFSALRPRNHLPLSLSLSFSLSLTSFSLSRADENCISGVGFNFRRRDVARVRVTGRYVGT